MPLNTNASDYTVIALTPKQGYTRTRLSMYLIYLRITDAYTSFSLIVEGNAVRCSGSQPNTKGHSLFFTLKVEIPSLELTIQSKLVGLFLQVGGINSTIVSKQHVSNFLYYNNSYSNETIELSKLVLKQRLLVVSYGSALGLVKKTSA